MRELLVSDFDFDLPEELIAQEPPIRRGFSRMLVFNRTTGAARDSDFSVFPSLLRPDDLLVLNDTRVIPARLFCRRTLRREKETPLGRIEVMLTEPAGEDRWRALVRPGRKVSVGEKLVFPDADGQAQLEAEVLEHHPFGERVLKFQPVKNFFEILERIGHVPLPPYIHRPDSGEDRERYQTVFAQKPGSVAAPTAGLHFSEEILAQINRQGIEIAKVTLHVGLGTFAPLRVDRVSDIRLHKERYDVPGKTAEAINRARRSGRRIVAVGTTTVRTLEAAASQSTFGELRSGSGETDIFIAPGFEFRIVGAILTNFHLPRSSLLMLVSAFGGREKTLDLYRHAVQNRYRFFSYGDCVFIE